jgi:LmbE family N-acetylglucosaminyl deacetylase
MRTLAIAPHPDDETYGCGGTLARRARGGAEVHVVVVAASGVDHPDGRPKCTLETRRGELAEACRLLGVAEHAILYEGLENALDTLPLRDLVTRLDRVLARADYDEVLFPGPSHHQDHRAVLEAAYAALRVRPGRRTERRAAQYELAYGRWHSGQVQGAPWYVDVAATLPTKLAAVAAYSSQRHPDPAPLSAAAVTRLAALRGTECGLEHAERLHLVRAVE